MSLLAIGYALLLILLGISARNAFQKGDNRTVLWTVLGGIVFVLLLVEELVGVSHTLGQLISATMILWLVVFFSVVGYTLYERRTS